MSQRILSSRVTQQPRRAANRRKSPVRLRKHQHLCEVKARAHKVRQHRNRWIFGIVARLVLVISLAGGIFYGACRALDHLFLSNPDYNLAELTIDTDGNMNRDEVVRAAGVRLGQNIFLIQLRNIRDDLELLPRVHRAEVKRHMPNRLSIRVTERIPVAWLVPEDPLVDPFTIPGAFLVDARAVVMSAETLMPEYLRLPIISGVDTSNFLPGNFVDSEPLRAALDLLRLTDSAGADPVVEIRSIDLTKEYCMIVTDARRTKFTMALDRQAEQLERARALVNHTRQRGVEIATANLMLRRDIPVTFQSVALDATEAPGESDGIPVMRALPLRQ